MLYLEEEKEDGVIGEPILDKLLQFFCSIILTTVNAIRLRLPWCKKEKEEVDIFGKREEKVPVFLNKINPDATENTVFLLTEEGREITIRKAYFLIFKLKEKKIELEVDRETFESTKIEEKKKFKVKFINGKDRLHVAWV